MSEIHRSMPLMTSTKNATLVAMTNVTIVSFDGMDLLDAGGPYEVFLTAWRLLARKGAEQALNIQFAAVSPGEVETYGGLRLRAATALADVTETDVLVVPGAIDIDRVTAETRLISEVARLAPVAGIVLSVCTGAFILGSAGLLEGHAWTTHWEDISMLADRIGADGARRDHRWVDNGQIVTAAGISSGIAGALHVVERLHSRELAMLTARQIEYTWDAEGSPTPLGR